MKNEDRPAENVDVQEINPQKLHRRRFLTGLALGAGLAPLSAVFRKPVAATPSAVANDLCFAPSGGLLSTSDFQPLGYFDIRTDEMAYIKGLTHRYVNGELRMLFITLRNGVQEVSLAGRSSGDVITSAARAWQIPFERDHRSISWDEASGRLFTLEATDYTNEVVPVQLKSYVLNANGTVSGATGPTGLNGINAKRAFGGVLRVPADLQGPLRGQWMVVGGGYTSLVAQGGSAALGLSAYAIGDPLAGGSVANTVLADHPFTGNDWYGSGSPANFDRGRRITRPLNYFDGGGTNLVPNGDPAGDYPPTTPPVASGQWLSPAPDGFGRWTWGDSYWNTHQWITTPTKRGLVAVFSGGGGATWYGMSTLHSERREFELHVFNPAHLAEVAAGSRKPWQVQPSSIVELLLPGAGKLNPNPRQPGNNGNDSPPNGNVIGATYDATTQRYYMLVSGVGATDWETGRLYVFQVA